MKQQDAMSLLGDLLPTRDEALDLLGDLLPATATGLFGDKPAKIVKPRPQWRLDGFVVVRQKCRCLNCGNLQVLPNPLILISESYVDVDGNILKSKKTSNPDYVMPKTGENFMHHTDINYEFLPVTHETVMVEPSSLCGVCYPEGDSASDIVLRAFTLQRQQAARREQLANTTVKVDPDVALAAERRLLDMIDSWDGENG